MNKFTEGEWFAKRDGWSTVYAECRIGGGMLQEVAACGPTANGPDEQEANARLISAAPDLLEALEAFERISALWLPAEVEEQHAEEMYALHMARNQMLAAIAKARGEV